MSIYTLERTKRTPQIYFNQVEGELKISGRSLPENSNKFYHELLIEIDRYIIEPNNSTLIIFDLDYINSISTKVILNLIRRFEILLKLDLEVNVIWNYQDDDDIMQEVGESIKVATNVPIQVVDLSLV